VARWLFSFIAREFSGLDWYLRVSGEWNRNAKARAILDRLSSAEQARLRRLSTTLDSRRGRPTWRPLLCAIAADQVIFEHIIRKKRLSRAQLRGSGGLAEVADDFKTGAGRVKRVYAAYRKQASTLRDEWRPNSKEARHLRKVLGPPPAPRDPAPARAPMEWPVVFHWFAHALRDLCRYRDNHPKLPWSSKCASRCLRNRDRLSGISTPRSQELRIETPAR